MKTKTIANRPVTNFTSITLASLLRFDESKADKVKAALTAKYPEDKEALGKIFAANMLGPSLWFPAMEMWSARKTEPVEETIAALTPENREILMNFYKPDSKTTGLQELLYRSAGQ